MDYITNSVFLLGLNHDTAPLEIRERIAIDSAKVFDCYADLKHSVGVEEALILSTCNRTEIYFSSADLLPVSDWIVKSRGLPAEFVREHFYQKSQREVLTHAASVASGLDSMVIGETQIFGQMKVAYQQADAANSLGAGLRKVFDTAFSIAKEVRSNTSIGAHSVSMASAALRTVERIFPDTEGQSVLFVGAGEMIDLCSQHFSKERFRSFYFSNRTIERAKLLAAKHGGHVVELSELADGLSSFDVLVTCTASPIPILGKGAFEVALRRRLRKPMAVFDLAVPRDVEPAVKTLEDIFIFTVDDLGALVRQGLSVRHKALDEANDIISKRLNDFYDKTPSNETLRAVKRFRSFGRDLVQKELGKALVELRSCDDPEVILRDLCYSIEKKFLDRPSRTLNKARSDQRDDLSRALTKLFNLEDPK